MRIPKTKYTMFPNEAMEAFCKLKPTGAHAVVFLYILRHTVGCQRERQRISITKMSKELPYSKKWLLDVVSDLENMGILKITHKKNGSAAVFEVLEPGSWDTPVTETEPWAVNYTSPVNSTSPTGELQFHGVVNSTSPQPVNYTSPQPVNSTSPIKETIKKKLFKKKTALPDGGSSKGKENPDGNMDTEGPEDPDGDWEDPMETLRKLREERTRDGDL